MPVETAKYVNQLKYQQPAGGESISEGDDHLRVIKYTLTESFPEINDRVNATSADLNKVPQMATDLEALKVEVGDLDSGAHGNVASCYYKNGSKLYSHNVGSITKTPGNDFGTRVNFSPALEGSTPDHYAFSVTPVTQDSVGRPLFVTVSNATKDFIDFLAVEFIDPASGAWAFREGATVDFSLLITDMDSGQ